MAKFDPLLFWGVKETINLKFPFKLSFWRENFIIQPCINQHSLRWFIWWMGFLIPCIQLDRGSFNAKPYKDNETGVYHIAYKSKNANLTWDWFCVLQPIFPIPRAGNILIVYLDIISIWKRNSIDNTSISPAPRELLILNRFLHERI